jgi:sarcosine oxidase
VIAADVEGRVELVVVGLGPMGAGALRHAAARGVHCLGIGSAEPAVFADHAGPFASHYDSGRVTRHVDATFEWAELARRAIADYPAIEQRSGIGFHRPVGVLYAVADEATALAVERVAGRLGPAGAGIGRTVDVDPRVWVGPVAAVFAEPAPAGHVDPRRMVAAQLATARADGATVVADEVVRLEQASGGGWRLHTATGQVVDAAEVVLAGGPHTDELLDRICPLELDVRPEVVVTAVIDAPEQRRLRDMPSLLSPVDDPRFADIYLVPPTDYPDGTVRIKLGATRHAPMRATHAAARREWMRGDRHVEDLAVLRRLTEEAVPGLVARDWQTHPCLIADTPSGLPYVDHVAAGLVVAAGCNGYAAKSGDAVGALAASLAIDGTWRDPVLAAGSFSVRDRRQQGHG